MSRFYKRYNLAHQLLFKLYFLLNYLLLKFKISVIYYYYTDKKILNLINELRYKQVLLLTVTEALQVYECAKSALGIKGDYAEVGVFKGGSASVILEGKKNKNLYLFDTFEGLPLTSKIDALVETNDMASNFEEVKKRFRRNKDVFIFKGFFPKTGSKIKNKKFAFVHLDVDLYNSTLDSLIFFYPRMVKGGIILTHDYPFLPGVKKAFDEFFNKKSEKVIKLSGNQGLVIKTG